AAPARTMTARSFGVRCTRASYVKGYQRASQRTTTSRCTTSARNCARSLRRGKAPPPIASSPRARRRSRPDSSPESGDDAPSAGAELGHPRQPAQAEPQRREHDVEEDDRDREKAPPDGPAPPGNGRLRPHLRLSAAASALRPSTVRR